MQFRDVPVTTLAVPVGSLFLLPAHVKCGRCDQVAGMHITGEVNLDRRTLRTYFGGFFCQHCNRVVPVDEWGKQFGVITEVALPKGTE